MIGLMVAYAHKGVIGNNGIIYVKEIIDMSEIRYCESYSMPLDLKEVLGNNNDNGY